MPSIRTLALAAAASTAYAAPAAKRQAACTSLTIGSGPVPSPDAAEAFLDYEPFSTSALAAVTPAGYVQAYSDLHTTYDEPSQFVKYTEMSTYDVQGCADSCNNDAQCNAFTVFYERAPIVEPGNGCLNPYSSTLIKCDLWAGTILPDIALNSGQMRKDFHVVISGSNGYVKEINTNGTLPTIPSGYGIESYENGAAIEAPVDCNGQQTYMGLSFWHDGRFDIQRCLDSCQQATVDDIEGRHCHFVNTYMQRRDGVPYAQHCAMYTAYWPSQYATNYGQTRSDAEISISDTDSFGIRDLSGDYDACLPGQNSTNTVTMTNDPSSTITYYMTGNPGDDTTSQSQPQVTYSRRAAVMIPASNLPTLTSTATAFSNAVSESA